MKRPEMFRREEERLAAEVERDLQAVDGALAGLQMHTDFDELAALAVAIRDERPTIDDEFAAMLDERAARGFPEPQRAAGARVAASRMGERLAAMRPGRLIPAVGAAASLLVVTGVAVSVLKTQNGNGTDNSSASSQLVSSDSASSASEVAPSAQAKKATSASGGSAGGGGVPFTSSAQSADEVQRLSKQRAHYSLAIPNAPDADVPGSLTAPGRHVSQTANLTLSTDPDKVRTISSSVTEIVRRYRGLVISSRITSGKGSAPSDGVTPLPFETGALGAEFQLRIPSSQIDNALNDLSGLGLVVSREQGTQDITGRFASTHDRIQSLTSERDQLIKQLSAPFITQDAIDAINARLRAVRAQLAAAQGDLGNLKARVAMVPVHVSVVAKGSGGGDSGFDLGDAAHDAGRVLTVGAGVALISLAVIVPLGLIATVAWFATSRARRRRRESALD